MPDSTNIQIEQLLKKIDTLIIKQHEFSTEINSLKEEIDFLRKSQQKSGTPILEKQEIPQQETPPIKEIPKENPLITTQKSSDFQQKKIPKKNQNLEKFIGENLINKIGIIITVIGVGIGAKYAINHQLISPLTRIILGYFVGIGLLGFSFKLKEKYKAYSAVLLSGGMAILYFISYIAYSFYGLLPQSITFTLMVLFTVFTVLAALNYNQEIIALIGLVGAYAVPFLLSNDSGNALFLFSYIFIINLGILFIAFKKYWKPLYYTAFVITWLIYLKWYDTVFNKPEYFTLSISFLLLFFLVFYTVFLAYKLLKKEAFNKVDIVLILVNSFIFFGIGYSILQKNESTSGLLGLFAVFTALIHFGVSWLVYKQKLGDKHLFYFVIGLVLVFLTLAIPIQLDGNWVTLLWIGEATLLYWVGRTKKIAYYEKLAYPLLFLGFVSIIHDWSNFYNSYQPIINSSKLLPLWNVQFLSSILFITALGYMTYIKTHWKTALVKETTFSKILGYSIPVVLLLVIYFSFRMEISNYWHQLFADSTISIPNDNSYAGYTKNYDLNKFKSIWLMNYTLFFFSILTYIGSKFTKIKKLHFGMLFLNAMVLLVFLLQTLYLFSELRESYLTQSLAQYYTIGSYHLWIRYISYLFVALLIGTTYHYIIQKTENQLIKDIFELVILGSILWIASSELIHWMDLYHSKQSYKFGLSILWGSYSLMSIVLGIWKKKKPIRVAGIVLFAITLLKLFLYDISDLNTIAKTIAFVSLGVLLLIISFLYNKYKKLIFDDDEN